MAKIAIFLPVPISAVAASIIWKFMFDYQPPGTPQTGTLNAVLGDFARLTRWHGLSTRPRTTRR